MICLIKKFFKLVNDIFVKRSSNSYIKYLRKKGVKIGNNTMFHYALKTTVDTSSGHFITIGDNCKITQGVIILGHDYSYSVLRPVFHDIPLKVKETVIGNNVFIGMNSVILMGSNIGNNVIVGAGSVVSGKIPDNEVWGGNPAHFICTLEEYYKKCASKFEEGAKLTVEKYNERYGRNPSVQELQYFSMLFLNSDQINAKKEYNKMLFSGDNKEEVVEDCLKYKSKYNSYDDFIKSVKNRRSR